MSSSVETDNNTGQYRDLELLVYPGGIFKSHWAFWIPARDAATRNVPLKDGLDIANSSHKGTKIDATGDVRAGFQIEIDRDDKGPADDRRPKRIVLGRIEERYLAESEQSVHEDKTLPRTMFEKEALKIPAPGPSLNSSSEAARRDENVCGLRSFGLRHAHTKCHVQGRPLRRTRIAEQDCQYWLKQVVQHMCSIGIIEKEALDIVNTAPVKL